MKEGIIYTKRLENAGFTREQAEAQIEVLDGLVMKNIATKDDINLLKNDFNNLKEHVDLRFSSMRSEIEKMEHKIVNKLGLIITLAMGGIATFFKFVL